MANFITLKTSDYPTDLLIAKTYLEDRGIPCYMKDEFTNQVHPYALGGAKLQVLEEDAERAAKLLVEGGFANKEDFEISKPTMYLVKIYDKIISLFKGNK